MRKSFFLLAGCAVAVSAAIAWNYAGAPTSIAEARFLNGFSKVRASERIDLAKLMPGDWELVCESHGYDGPMYLKKYNRTYEPVAAPDDATWGLIFISADGSYVPASGSCRLNHAKFYVNGCSPRESAKLIRKESSSGCTTFSTVAD